MNYFQKAKQRAAEIVGNDSGYNPDELFWNMRYEATITGLFIIYKEREHTIKKILEETPDELYKYLETNKHLYKPSWAIIEGSDEKTIEGTIKGVQAILERLLPSELCNEYIH